MVVEQQHHTTVYPALARKSPGTLGVSGGYGVGNPRHRVSDRLRSLLKFQTLKLKGS